MSKYCPKCGKENDNKSTFCRGCGERLSGIHTNSDNPNDKNRNKILIGVIIALLIAIAIIGTYAFVALNNNNDTSDTTAIDNPVTNVSNSSVSDSSNVNTKS